MVPSDIPPEHARAEALAAAVPGVLEAAVCPGEGEDGHERLEVFVVVPGPAARLEAGARILRTLALDLGLAGARLHFPAALPRSPRGDIDRARLADPRWRADPEAASRLPAGGPRRRSPEPPARPRPPRRERHRPPSRTGRPRGPRGANPAEATCSCR